MDTLAESSIDTETLRNVYCLFCKTGKEQSLAFELEKRGVSCLIAYASRVIVKNGKELREKRRLLPGYVFLETDAPLSRETRFLHSNADALKLLSYEPNEYVLRGSDLAFYKWLKERNGVFDVSQVYRVGDRIKVVRGPLKEYEGCIVEVNKRRKCVAFSLGGNSLINKIWCSIEYVELDSDPCFSR